MMWQLIIHSRCVAYQLCTAGVKFQIRMYVMSYIVENYSYIRYDIIGMTVTFSIVVIVYRNTRRLCDVTKRAYRCRVREF